MELSEEVRAKAEKFVASDICFGGLEYSLSGNIAEECERSYIAGYHQALKDFAEKEAKHRNNMMEIGMKTMSGDIYK